MKRSFGSIALAVALAACGSARNTTSHGGATGGGASGSGGAGGNGDGGTGVGIGGLGGRTGGSVSGGATGGENTGTGGRGAGGAATGGASGGSATGGAGGRSNGSGNTGTGGIGTGSSGGRANGGSSGGGTGGSAGGALGGAGSGGSSAAGGTPTGGATGVGGSAEVCPKPQAQACYFVSPTGSDTNAGSETAPFETVSKARDVVRTINSAMTGDIFVYLRGGDHRITSAITLESKDSGTGTRRIFYLAYPGERPVLNGATKVTGWTQDKGNIYKASLDRTTKLRNLYVNDQRALMASKTAASKGGSGTFSVTSGQASWAWSTGSGSDGINYSSSDIPEITSNKDDLEIVNGTTWNENIACTRDVVTNGSNRTLLLQQPYGAIAQLPGWSAGFSVSGTHTVFNAYEFLSAPGTFYFNKTTGTLYYIPRSGEDMASADVEAPVAEQLIVVAGTSKTDRVKNITFQGITFANTDYGLYKVEDSYGKASVQGATVFVAYGNGDWHASKYEIVDTFPAMIDVDSADSIDIVGNVIKHSGTEGIGMHNDVINSNIVGNFITDTAGSGITIGHPQHVYVGDGGSHAKYTAAVEGVCTKDTINNNLIYNVSTVPGFGGHSGITAFFVDTLSITHNHIHSTAYNGINLGWGWKNFKDSTTCKNNVASYNRFTNIMTRLHDSGAIYTIGQEPDTTINENYVKGIPPATSGPTYGLHNDEGSAYITENDNVLDIDKNVKYTINCEDFGDKHDLTILRTYATVNKMGANPPTSQIDPPVVVADAVWPLKQYGVCVASGIEDKYRSAIPSTLLATADYVFPASCAAPSGTATLTIRSSGDAANTVWFAPAGTTTFTEGATMTKAAGNATSIAVPTTAGTYKLSVVDSQGKKLGESASLLRVGG
jgi:hypothetical protein